MATRVAVMATYDAELYLTAFENMEALRKTVYAVLATPEYGGMVSGDRLEFGSHGSIRVGMVRRYPNLEELVEAEGWQCLVPEADSATNAISLVRAVDEWDANQESQVGVLAIRVRDVKRKT